MPKFVYVNNRFFSTVDPVLTSSNYKHREWFGAFDWKKLTPHVNSRVDCPLPTPFPLSTTLFPIPDLSKVPASFEQAIESAIDRFCQEQKSNNKKICICWSGGIDSTLILVGFLRVADADIIQRIVVLLDQNSINENPYFYHHYIKDHLSESDLQRFEITQSNYQDLIIVDGEGGNQCYQGLQIQRATYLDLFELLDSPWQQNPNFVEVLRGANSAFIEYITQSTKSSPVPIRTVYDLAWWANFNFKYDDVMIRKIFHYCRNLTAKQTKEFWNNNLFRLFADPAVQAYAMTTLDQRRQQTKITVKYPLKKYIYEFDCNDFYWSSKGEQGSYSSVFLKNTSDTKFGYGYFGYDEDWNCYSMSDATTRQYIGQLLERN